MVSNNTVRQVFNENKALIAQPEITLTPSLFSLFSLSASPSSRILSPDLCVIDDDIHFVYLSIIIIYSCLADGEESTEQMLKLPHAHHLVFRRELLLFSIFVRRKRS